MEILRYIEYCVILFSMLPELGDESLEEWREESPSNMDDPDKSPEEEATYS